MISMNLNDFAILKNYGCIINEVSKIGFTTKCGLKEKSKLLKNLNFLYGL